MKKKNFWLAMSALMTLALTAAPVDGAIIIDDVFSDGSAAANGPLEADFYGSSTSAALEENASSLGLVSGTSGRQIHAIFPTQTLGTAGDFVKSTVIFTTPAFILSNMTQAEFDAANDDGMGGTLYSVGTVPASSDDLKIGLFDHLGRTGLFQDTSYSSSNPNADYIGIPGYAIELDVDPSTITNQDIDIRRSDPSTTGRLLSTNTGVPSIGSGSDIGYVFAPNTQYSVMTEYLLDAAGGLQITATFDDVTNGVTLGTHTVTDAAPNSFSFGMLGIGASSEAFGLSNDGGVADNGIDLNRFIIESEIAVAAIPEPGSLSFLLGTVAMVALRRRR